MSWDFRVGQKVVCVDGWVQEPGCGYGDENGPVLGGVYTIREVGILHPKRYPGTVSTRLHEIINPVHDYRIEGLTEASFRATRFRPLVTKQTDISIFTAMLTPKKVSEPA